MKIKEIAAVIEELAPLRWQESYDNAGLVVGRMEQEVTKALIAVDVTDAVLDEAEREGCDLVITHHPLIFHPLKRFNGEGYVQRLVERAIRQGIALYACHTNLDSAPGGMSYYLATQLGIGNLSLLEPRSNDPATGFGVVGELAASRPLMEYLQEVKSTLGIGAVRHSTPATDVVKRVAVCTGAGASLMEEARRAGCDLYLTADLKYNDYMTPDGAFTVADIGHFESEYCAIQILFDVLSKKLLTFAVRKSECSCNPIHYLV